jgi:hypothetical protein
MDGTADWSEDVDTVALSDSRESSASSREEMGPTCDAIFQKISKYCCDMQLEIEKRKICIQGRVVLSLRI